MEQGYSFFKILIGDRNKRSIAGCGFQHCQADLKSICRPVALFIYFRHLNEKNHTAYLYTAGII